MRNNLQIDVIHPGARLHCVSYLVTDHDTAIIIDPGPGTDEDALLRRIRATELQPADIDYVLLTHCHVDHALGTDTFARLGARVVASPDAARALEAGSHRVWYEHPDRVHPIHVAIHAPDRELLQLGTVGTKVLHTPGHTSGDATYIFRQGGKSIAFTGDLLMPNGQPGWTGSDGFSGEALLKSLDRLLRENPDRVFPGHGPIIEKPAEWLRDGIRLSRISHEPTGKFIVND